MSDLAVWRALVGSRVRSQLSYRRSFALDCVGQLATTALEFVEIYAVTHQVGAVDGWDLPQLVLLFALAQVAFAIGDLTLGQTDRISTRIRAGTLDVLLVRPLPVLAQLAVDDLQLRRLVRLASALVLLGIGVRSVDPTPAAVLLLVLTPTCGAVVFASLFVVAGAANVRLGDAREFTNALTYGSNYLSQWPLSVLATTLGRFFTFVVPAAFVAYLPACRILGKPVGLGLPGGLAAVLVWCGPVAAAWAASGAALAWRAALRHYSGAGG